MFDARRSASINTTVSNGFAECHFLLDFHSGRCLRHQFCALPTIFLSPTPIQKLTAAQPPRNL
jgi:hypothetical protein